jgi:hypothetical protein
LLITAGQGIQFLWLAVSSGAELSAEVLFLRKQFGVLSGTPGSAKQAHRRRALLLGAVVSPLQLEKGVDDQAGDSSRLASRGLQAVLAVQVAVGKTADSGKSSPGDCAHGAGESDLGRGTHRSRTVGEVRDLGFAANRAGVLAATY